MVGAAARAATAAEARAATAAEELEAHGRDGSFRSSVRIVHVDSEGQRKEDREDDRRAERDAKRQAEAERLARLGY